MIGIKWQTVEGAGIISDDPDRLLACIWNEVGSGGILDDRHLPFLRGLRAAGVDGAYAIMYAIQSNGPIRVWGVT